MIRSVQSTEDHVDWMGYNNREFSHGAEDISLPTSLWQRWLILVEFTNKTTKEAMDSQ